MNPWRHAVDDALVNNLLDCTSDDDDPSQRVRQLLDWSNTMALDPRISSEAQALIERGRAMIREANEKIGTELARQLDLAFSEAIDRVLGRGTWTPEDLKGRLHEISRMGDDYSVVYLDGKPILALGCLQTKVRDGMFTASRRVRWMVDQKE